MSNLMTDLDTLHDRYVELVNLAIADDNDTRADQLAAQYDAEATRLVAAREGKLSMLPLRRQSHAGAPRRSVARRLHLV